jgi:hypothetical protein
VTEGTTSETANTLTTVRLRIVLGLLFLVIAAAVAGCGGGGETTGADAGETTTETAGETDTTEGPVDELAPSGPDTVLCREVTSTSSELNIAASNGDFATVAKRWKELQPEFPADVQPHIDTVAEGYGKVAADPNQYSVLGTSPYKEALDAVNAHTGSACA